MKFLVYNIAYGTGAPRNRLDQVFGLHRYLHTENRPLERIIDCIEKCSPDVSGLLEVDHGSFRTGYQDQGELIARSLHQYACGAVKSAPGSISRKVPILRRQSNLFLTQERQLPCAFHYLTAGMKRLALEIEVDGVRFFLLHLSLRKSVRQRQLKTLSALLQGIKTLFLIGGDFNAFGGSGELNDFMNSLGLASANRENSPTFPSWHPEKQLDYILYSREIEPLRFQVGPTRASDHLPVMLEFKVR